MYSNLCSATQINVFLMVPALYLSIQYTLIVGQQHNVNKNQFNHLYIPSSYTYSCLNPSFTITCYCIAMSDLIKFQLKNSLTTNVKQDRHDQLPPSDIFFCFQVFSQSIYYLGIAPFYVNYTEFGSKTIINVVCCKFQQVSLKYINSIVWYKTYNLLFIKVVCAFIHIHGLVVSVLDIAWSIEEYRQSARSSDRLFDVVQSVILLLGRTVASWSFWMNSEAFKTLYKEAFMLSNRLQKPSLKVQN